MSDWEIFHNPRCSKSRRALEILEEKGISVNVVKYLETPPTKERVLKLLELLCDDPQTLIRTKEAEFEKVSLEPGSKLSIAVAIEKYPILMERPVISNGHRAIIARPPEKVLELLK